MMKKRAMPIAVLLTVGALAVPMALAPGDPAPTVVGADERGLPQYVDWSTHELNVVNFWATWCAPCQRELPRLQELHRTYGERGLRVIGISKDRLTFVEIESWLAPLGIDYPILLDGGRVSKAWGGVGTLPTTFLIGNDGTVLRRYVGGAEAATEALVGDVEAFMEGRPLGPPYVPRVEPEVSTPEATNR